MTVSTPPTPTNKPSNGTKQVKTYAQYVEDLPAMIEQLANNQPACMHLMIAVNNVKEGK